MNIQRAT